MKKILKQTLLRFGGYTVAQNLYTRIEERKLMQRVRTFLKTGLTPLPDMVMFEPTLRCNLRCKMCYQDRVALTKHSELSLQQIIDFFDQTPYLRKVTLIGGEIFMRRDIIDLIHHLNRTRDIVISTNGTLMNDAEIKALRDCHRIMTISISLDGPEIVHESIRRSQGCYEKTIKTIKTLSPIFPVTVTCVIQNENLKDLPDVVDLCATAGVKKVKLELERIYAIEEISQVMIEMGLAREDLPKTYMSRMRNYSIEDLMIKLDTCQSQGKKAGVYVEFEPSFLMDEIEACYTGNLRNHHKYICQSFRMATIAPNGNLINCFAIRKPFGNILDRPFNEIWNSEAANTYRRQLIRNNLTSLCESCPFMIPYHEHQIID